MLTGLVYIAVILLWAVVLVPQWLRRHERNSEHRTTLTFHRAMRTLERRRLNRSVSRARHDVDVTVAGARSRVHDRVSLDDQEVSPIDQHLDSGIDPFRGTETEEHLRSVRTLRAKSNAISKAGDRRRQIMQALGGLSIVCVVLMLMGVIPFMLAMLPVAGLGGFAYMSKRQAKAAALANERRARRIAAREEAYETTVDVREVRQMQEAAERAPRSERSASSRSASSRRSSSRSSSSRRYSQASSRTRQQSSRASQTRNDDIRVLSASESEYERARANVSSDWDAVEAPLPGYLDSARATRIRRNIDSTANGDWTGERMLEQVEALRDPRKDAEAELGLDDYIDIPGYDERDGYGRRRAVNE